MPEMKLEIQWNYIREVRSSKLGESPDISIKYKLTEVENSGKVRSAIRSEVEVLLFCMFWHELME